MTEAKEYNHIIGCTRTIRTAVLVVEYLKQRHASPRSVVQQDEIRYRFKGPTPENGYWSADIIVRTYSNEFNLEFQKAINSMIGPCRAFVAGAGEIWT